MKLKEGARWILCIFFRAVTAGQVKQGTGALLELEGKKREMESVLKPPQAVRRGGEGERWEECRNNSSFTPEILIFFSTRSRKVDTLVKSCRVSQEA